MRIYFLVGLLATGMVSLVAQVPSDSLHHDITLSSELEEITVTSSPVSRQPGIIGASVSAITDHSLAKDGYLDLRAPLEQVPGLQMQSGAPNTSRITIRGVGTRTPYASNRVKAWFDEIPLTSGDGATTVGDLELSLVDRVEVVRGPSSAVYGPGMGGVLIFSPQIPGLGFRASVLSGLGSFGTFKNTGTLSYRKENSFLQVSIADSRSDGYRENSEYNRSNILLHGRLTAGIHSLSLLAGYTDLLAYIPSSVDLNSYRNTPQKAAANWLAMRGHRQYDKWQGGLSLKSDITESLSNTLVLYGMSTDAYETRPFNILDELTNTIGMRAKLVLQKGRTSVMAGLEYFDEQYKWKIFEIVDGKEGQLQSSNSEKRHFINFQVHADYRLTPTTVVTGGVNVHRLFFSRSEEIGHLEEESHNYPWILSPRVGLNQRLSTTMYLYASAGHGFSAPSPEEALLPDGGINRDLKPEEGITIDGGLRGTFWHDRLQLNLTVYSINVRNMLMTRRDAEDIFYGENAGKTKHRGLETDLRLYILPYSKDRINMTLAASHTWMSNRFKHFIQDETDYSGKTLPGQPASMLNLSLEAEAPGGIFLQVRMRNESSQYLDDANTMEYGGHSLFDLAAGYKSTKGKLQNLGINAGIRNLADTRYASMLLVNATGFGSTLPRYYYPGQPRNFFLTLSYSF